MGIALFRVLFWIVPRLTCKPGSVVYGHLSGRIVADALKRYSQPVPDEQSIWHRPNLAPDGVYTARSVTGAPVSSYLPFPSLQIALRSVSVALSLESPPPDVIRRPALRCPDFPHGLRRAAVQPTRNNAIIHRGEKLCQSVVQKYYNLFLCKITCYLKKNIIKCIR